MAGPDPLAPNPSRVVLEALALSCLWTALYLPNLGKPEYENEEGRRVIPAREMAQAGDPVLPTIFGRPYIAKPPAFYWAIGLVGSLRGEIDETSARLPAAVATLAGAWSVLAFAARFLGRPAARAGGLLFLLTPLVLEKGTLAEIEPLLGATVFGASALAWIGSRGNRVATLAAVPLLALAVLAKGPAAWVFFGAAILAAAIVERARARSVLLTGGLVLAASTALAGIWLALLVRDLGWARLSETWAGEVTGGAKGPSYLTERLRFVSRSLGAFGIGTLLAVLALVDRRSRWLEPIPVRIALVTSVLGFAFFLVFPRAQARYLYPLAPWVALLAGHVLARACEPHAAHAPRAAAALVRGLVLAIGAAGVLVPLVALAARAGWLELPLELDATALAAAAVLAVLSAAAILLLRRSARSALAIALAVLVLGRTSQLLLIGPRASTHARREGAARVDRAVPAGVTIHAALWSEFNLLAYVAHPLVWVEDPLALAPGETAVFVETGAPRAPSADWVILDRIPLEAPRSLVVAARVAPPGGPR